MKDIDATEVSLVNKNITFALGGHTVEIRTTSGSKAALTVNGGSLTLTGSGALNVIGGGYRGVEAKNFANVTVTNAYTNGNNGKAAYAETDATLLVTGDAESSKGGTAAMAFTGGKITVQGNAKGNGNRMGAYANGEETTVYVKGHAIATGTTSETMAAVAVDGGTVTVEGDAIGTAVGALGQGAGSRVLVLGNVESTGQSDSINHSYGAHAIEGTVEVGKNIRAVGRADLESVGANVSSNGGTIMVDGTIMGDVYVKVGTSKLPITLKTIPTTKPGYHTYTYSGALGRVWVKDVSTPPTTYNATISGGTASPEKAEAGETVTITANPAPSGEQFKEWRISPAVTFTEGTSKTDAVAKFIMPAQEVMVEAMYEDIPAVVTPVTGVALNKTSLSLYSIEIPNTTKLTATVFPANATNKSVTWISGNPAVAEVDATGKVTAVGNGVALITVTTNDGDHKAVCTVTVSKYSSDLSTGSGDADTDGGGKSTKEKDSFYNKTSSSIKPRTNKKMIPEDSEPKKTSTVLTTPDTSITTTPESAQTIVDDKEQEQPSSEPSQAVSEEKEQKQKNDFEILPLLIIIAIVIGLIGLVLFRRKDKERT